MAGVRGATTVVLVALLVSVGALGSAAGAQTRIGPDQHFIGLVNGSNDNPVVYTICAGPSWPGRTGPVAGRQSMSVAEVAGGAGYTGLFNRIYAWFDPADPTAAPTQLRFRRYGTPRSIPTSIRVPCDGTGRVTFSSCPFGAPCAAGWVPDHVDVQFVNIAD
jgi:hypothetical protein